MLTATHAKPFIFDKSMPSRHACCNLIYLNGVVDTHRVNNFAGESQNVSEHGQPKDRNRNILLQGRCDGSAC